MKGWKVLTHEYRSPTSAARGSCDGAAAWRSLFPSREAWDGR